MQVGFIGTGSMGSILIDALICSGALLPSQIIASNRTPSKAESLANRHAGLLTAPSNTDVVRASKLVMLCVKPLDYKQAIGQFAHELTADHVLITITSPVKLEQLEELVPCPVIRVIPSITNAALAGTTLLEFGKSVTEHLRNCIFTLFSQISHPVEVEDSFLRVAADLSSCGPAFISYVLQQMIQAATDETGISEEAATYLTTQMIIGFSELVKKDMFSLQTLEQRVCVPGGITGEGLIPLKQSIPGIFNQVFQRTQHKFAQDCQEVSLHLTRK